MDREEILELEPPLSVIIQVWRNWGDDAFFEAVYFLLLSYQFDIITKIIMIMIE